MEKQKIRSLLLLLLAVMIVVTGCGGGTDTATPTSAPQTGNGNNSAFTDLLATITEEPSAMTGQGDSVTVTDLSVTAGLNPDWTNILLLGADARDRSAARTDTMMIASVHQKTGQVKLTSLMRDTAVSIPGHGTKRLNSAYFYGGAELIMKVINENLGMNIQHYVYVDFSSFAVVAEALGGITMDITKNEMDHINKNVVEQYMIQIKNGEIAYEDAEATYYATELKNYGTGIHLNGMQALGFARIRKLDSDFARTERQRKVLNALLGNLRTVGTGGMLGLAMQLFPTFKTNMGLEQGLQLAQVVLNSANPSAASELRLPKTGTYKQERRNDDDMLYDTDFAANRQALYDFIYGA